MSKFNDISARVGSRPRLARRATAWVGGRAPLRILHVARTVDPAGDGPVRALLQLAAMHISLGHRAEVATYDPPASPWAREFPLPVFARGGLFRGSSRSPGFARWLRERCRDFDAVIVHGMRGRHVRATWRALYGTMTPYILVPHGELRGWALFRGLREMLGWPCALRDATGVLFGSASERERADRSSNLHASKSRVISDWRSKAFVEAVAGLCYRA